MKRIALILFLALMGTIGYWMFAQTAPAPMASMFPAGAMLYLDANDFSSLVTDWNGSAEKKAWLQSANYEAFSRSRLLLKLQQAQTEFAAAAGLPPDSAMLASVAGANSALAIYNIGDLQFLYVTHLAAARAMDTGLWKARATYQTRRAGGVDYFVRTDAQTRRTAAFAYEGDRLMLATNEALMAGALELAAGQTRPSMVEESWFANATRAASPGSKDLRLVYDLEALRKSPHFRSYWIQRNASELAGYTAGLADLERMRGNIEERRVMLRATAVTAPVESASGQAAAMIPDDAGFSRIVARPAAGDVEQRIEQELFHASAPAGAESSIAPVAIEEGNAGSEQDLETRIDEAPLNDDRNRTAFRALREAISGAQVQATLEAASTRTGADRVFTGFEWAMLLIAQNGWDARAMENAGGSAASALWSEPGLGANWRAGANGVRELEGLGRLAMAVDGRVLVIGDSPGLVAAIFARRNRAPAAGAAYAAEWRHARELPGYERMMRLIDYPQMPPLAAGADTREPMFFSENLVSLGHVLARVETASITVHDEGSMLRETVDYRMAP